ncbi:D-alanyl-D-alanine carboxypeptidase family protein [Sutcliffiella deserti]|uniref:D-alanyl-D-alanine carboxypeptidase family protein n=1 Tax=Sutcliffiella deserti TaxID=2875501 RepID=UPI001CBB6146|nr:D-alanyl-D-alanine carboxypeptidase family protein [Sutcliffiella deserti]
MMNKVMAIILLIPILLTLGLPIERTKASTSTLDLFSESVLLVDAKTGDVLFEKDSERVMYPASITKIVTALLAIEEGNLEDIVTVSKNARDQEGSRVYLLEGEQLSLHKLVKGLLINSGNDAGTAIAEHMNGSEKEFAKRMTSFVENKIGTKDTTFKNPHGLYNPDHVTTARDMAKIAKYAMENELFREIVGTKEIEWIGEGWETTLYNHHRLLWDYEGTTGVKNGFVPESGHTLITSAKRDDTELIAVTLKAASKYYSYQDTIKLLDYGFENFKVVDLKKGKMVKDASGKEYILAENISISTKHEEEMSFMVNEDMQLVIRAGDREFIKENALVNRKISEMKPLTIIEDEKIASTSVDSSEPKNSSLNSVVIFLGIIFCLLILSLIQRRWSKKRKQQRIIKSLTYSKKNNM